MVRGHLDVAIGILEIAQAQYKPKEETAKKRYSIRNDDDSDEYYSDEEEDSSDHGFRIETRLVDDQFTIDNIGEVSMQVKSDTQAYQIVNPYIPYQMKTFSVYKAADDKWGASNFIQLAIAADAPELLKFILQQTKTCLSWRTKEDEESLSVQISNSDFQYAIRTGSLTYLSEMIKSCGAGLALDSLVKSSGVEIMKKPKYYQGLSVYGKKREDWADAARGVRKSSSENSVPPLLQAALEGNMESVEWFLSDAPLNRYLEFARANKGDSRIKHLSQTESGFEKAVSKWLGTQSKSFPLHIITIQT